MKQESGESIHDFTSRMHTIWDQLTASEPTWKCTADVELFTAYRDQQRVVQFLMALHNNFESVRASLLHRSPLPTMDSVVSELLSEETRLGSLTPHHTEAVLATPPFRPKFRSDSLPNPSSQRLCKYCHKNTHSFLNCPTRICLCCQRKGPNHLASDCPNNPNRREQRGSYQNRPRIQSSYHSQQLVHPAAATTQSSSQSPIHSIENMNEPSSSSSCTTISVTELQGILEKYLSGSQTNSENAMSVVPGKPSWFFDSGCCNHMTSDLSLFSSKNSKLPTPTIQTADGSFMTVNHSGTISSHNVSLSHTYYVPKLTLNLISVGQLCELGFDVIFSNTGCRVQDPRTGQILGTGRKRGRMFELLNLHISPQYSLPLQHVASTSSTLPLSLWHSRLGHVSFSRLRTLVSSGKLGAVQTEQVDCVPCQLGKHHALPFSNSISVSVAPFDLVHSDIWGPSPNSTMGGSKYFVIFVDDYSRFTWIYLMHQRSELQQIYYNFANMVRTQFSCPIKVFRSDNAQEYREKEFLKFLNQNGTILHHSCPSTSQQNGRAERKHRHILDTVRTLLISSSCPERFWGEAALTAIYTINRVPSPTIGNQTPYERLYKKSPNYNLLRTFGCACFVLLQQHERTKLEPRARLCCFLGYGIEHKGYRCWDPSSKRLRISRHVIFWEHKTFASLSKFYLPPGTFTPYFTDPCIQLFPEDQISSTSSNASPPSPEEHVQSDDPDIDMPEPLSHSDPTPESGLVPSSPSPRYPTRVRQAPAHLRDFHCYSTVFSLHEPQSYREASSDPVWQKAMSEEIHALDTNHTWDLVDLPQGKSAISCKWIYKIKTNSDGSVERHKARLVAKGFSQEYGIDYEETFAPVARLTSVRSLLAVAATKRWKLFQMDVKNAFLNGDLTEEVYMKPPPGYPHPPDKVCKLRRALYGLKQAPRAWFSKFSSTIEGFGFTSSAYDSALFIRTSSQGTTLLLLYVDDMIITGDDLSGIAALKGFLSQQFEMKDLGNLSYFLGLEISSDNSGYYLTQAKYASDLILRAELSDNKTAPTPIESNNKLTPFDGSPLTDATRYRQLVGSLIYLTVTRPDIAYAVHLVSQFMASPRSSHFSAVIRIIRYIKGTLYYGLHFSAHSSLVLQAYSDADWAGDPTDRRSTTGFCFLLGDSLISWRSKKQSVTSRSSTESEYRALADTTQELIWLRWLLKDMGVHHHGPTVLHCDNQSAIQIAHNDVFHERTKHIETDCHFIRQHILHGTVRLLFIRSADQLADIFTKVHPPCRFLDLFSKLKLKHLQFEGGC